MARTREVDLPDVERGDTIKVNLENIVDETGAAVTASAYTWRATLKRMTDTAANDASALSQVYSPSNGISIINTNNVYVRFPPSATSGLTATTVLRYDVQATKIVDTTDVETLLKGRVTVIVDTTITSP